MQVKYVDQNQYYLVSNHAVAKNDIFYKRYYVKRFLAAAKFHLSPLCEIVGHAIHSNQFQLVVKLRSRENIQSYYVNRYAEKMKERKEIPATTYIFSQAMANLQSGLALHFNYREARTGAVFARRFSKVIIKSGQELSNWLERISKGKKYHRYVKRWWSGGTKRSWVWVREGREEKSWQLTAEEIKRLQGRLSKTQNLTFKRLFIPSSTKNEPPP